MLDGSHQDIRIGERERESNATLVPSGNPVLNRGPGDSGITALVNRTARSAAIEPERFAQALVRRRVQYVGIARVHHQIGRTGERIHVQDFRPRGTSVSRFVYPSLGITPP